MQIWTKQLASGLPIVLWKEHHSKNTSAFVQPGCLVWLVTTGSQYSKPTTQSKKVSPLMKVAQKKKENHVLATPFLHFSNHQLIHFVHGLRGAVSVVKLEQQVLNTKMQETSGNHSKMPLPLPQKKHHWNGDNVTNWNCQKLGEGLIPSSDFSVRRSTYKSTSIFTIPRGELVTHPGAL